MNVAEKRIREHCAKQGLNPQQTETVVLALKNKSDSQTIEMMDVLEAKKYSGSELISNLVIPYNATRLNNQFRKMIANGEFGVMQVQNESVYTVGLTNLHNFEFFMSTQPSGELLNLLAHEILSTSHWESIVNVPTESNRLTLADGITPSRFVVKEVSNVNTINNDYWTRLSDWTDGFPARIYQITLANEKNKLPGEFGYSSENPHDMLGTIKLNYK